MQGKKRDVVGATWSLSTRIAEEFLMWYVLGGMLPRRHPAQSALYAGQQLRPYQEARSSRKPRNGLVNG